MTDHKPTGLLALLRTGLADHAVAAGLTLTVLVLFVTGPVEIITGRTVAPGMNPVRRDCRGRFVADPAAEADLGDWRADPVQVQGRRP